MKNYNTLLAKVSLLKKGTIFQISEVDEQWWNGIPKGERLNLGRTFKSNVKKGKVIGVRYCSKTPDNHNWYEKI